MDKNMKRANLNIETKTKNNQSSFAKNPTHSYSDQYYASFVPGYKPQLRQPYPFIDPYVYPPQAFAPFLQPPYGYPYQFNRYDESIFLNNLSKSNANLASNNYPTIKNPKNNSFRNKNGSPTGILPYNYWMRPPVLEEKDPSIHDLLYLDTFRNKDRNQLCLKILNNQIIKVSFDLKFPMPINI